MRLSDAGLRYRPTKLIYPNHRFPPWLTEDAPRDRSNRLLEADRSDHACFRVRNNGNQLWNKRDEVCDSVRFGPQQNHGDVEFRQMLLERQIPINRNEYV
jgi:hypothetical protein